MIPQVDVDVDVDVDDIENLHEIQILDDELIVNVLRIVFEDQEEYRLSVASFVLTVTRMKSLQIVLIRNFQSIHFEAYHCRVWIGFAKLSLT
jgi:predicted nucleic acid-binding protein